MEQVRVKDQVREIVSESDAFGEEWGQRSHLKRRPSTSSVIALVGRRMRGASYNVPDINTQAIQRLGVNSYGDSLVE